MTEEIKPMELDDDKLEGVAGGTVTWFICPHCGDDVPREHWAGDYSNGDPSTFPLCPRCRTRMGFDYLT